ncbi:MAG: nitrite reductase large subunit NirB [Gammaproteobacteria bacterium]|nr:nitrite reductase large subunit NirB [Gammaproteobacteria bacterium]
MKELIVVGNGMAPSRALEKLNETDPDAYNVTIFNAEPRVSYNRVMLSPVLSGEEEFEKTIIHGDDWYFKHDFILYRGCPVTEIDREAKIVKAINGIAEPYDRLLIATGSSPVILDVPGHDKEGVLSYRDLDDVKAMLAAAETRRQAVVIGGGLLGLEAAAGLRNRGMEVTVVHRNPTLMDRQLDETAGHLLQRAIESLGIRVLTGRHTKAITGDEHVKGVLFKDGSSIQADIVIMAVGIRPSVWLAENAGLHTDRGIVVDKHMRTSDPDILAIGECAEFDGEVYGLLAPLYEMANVAAATLLGNEERHFEKRITAAQLKVTGIDLYSAGDFADGDNREEIVLRDPNQGVYKRLVIEGNHLVGTVLYGDTSSMGWYFQMIKDRTDISGIRDYMIFGPGYAEGAARDPTAAVASLPDDADICGCNGVSKGLIKQAIDEKNLTTLEGVRACTKASASCGTCTGLVEQLLLLRLGDSYQPAEVKPLCGCTDLGHSDVRRLISARNIMTIPDLMQKLEWKSSGGCAKCRPALNYYLLASWPGEYVDDNQSRFINERIHANIQKDGTYSVVPRMWGGVTSSGELRAIADVVDKFNIPTVKVTGGQRVDMLGVKKEDLPAVWADLNKVGLVSGHAYGKAIRTVKTCVGKEWCRFGTQDSTKLGIRLEKFLWGSWTPAKVKMAVSGCPRNCAEATCKDVGVVCVESGYDIHFAGAAGMDVRETQLLGHVDNDDDAIEMVAAVIQLYREQGHYLERIYKWAKRIGVDSIQDAVVDDAANRKALYARFAHSQEYYQIDPWEERVKGHDRHEFAPLKELETPELA